VEGRTLVQRGITSITLTQGKYQVHFILAGEGQQQKGGGGRDFQTERINGKGRLWLCSFLGGFFSEKGGGEKKATLTRREKRDGLRGIEERVGGEKKLSVCSDRESEKKKRRGKSGQTLGGGTESAGEGVF